MEDVFTHSIVIKSPKPESDLPEDTRIEVSMCAPERCIKVILNAPNYNGMALKDDAHTPHKVLFSTLERALENLRQKNGESYEMNLSQDEIALFNSFIIDVSSSKTPVTKGSNPLVTFIFKTSYLLGVPFTEPAEPLPKTFYKVLRSVFAVAQSFSTDLVNISPPMDNAKIFDHACEVVDKLIPRDDRAPVTNGKVLIPIREAREHLERGAPELSDAVVDKFFPNDSQNLALLARDINEFRAKLIASICDANYPDRMR